MKQVPCPRCQGTGIIEEDQTLMGIAPLLDRPSVVNDNDWPEDAADPGEPTAVCAVPTFKTQPPRTRESSLPALPDFTRIARESEKPTALIHRRDVLLEKVERSRSGWFVLTATVVFFFTLGAVLGVVGILHKDAVEHLLQLGRGLHP